MTASDVDFARLRKARVLLSDLARRQNTSLAGFWVDEGHGHGFKHRREATHGKPSTASTSTCINTLIHTSNWTHQTWNGHLADAGKSLVVGDWESAGLKKNNPFTVAFIHEGATRLLTAGLILPEERILSKLTTARANLLQALGKGNGGVAIAEYPENPYLTQLVVRSILVGDPALPEEQRAKTNAWAIQQAYKHTALLQLGNRAGDVYALVYSIILCFQTHDPKSPFSAEERSFLSDALGLFFRCQREDGTWPMSKPLFHYNSVGNADCFEYEALAELLRVHQLEDELLAHLPQLLLAVDRLSQTAIPLDGAGTELGWPSGHHPQLKHPESWSTATAYDFANAMSRLIGEAIRRRLFDVVGIGPAYRRPRLLEIEAQQADNRHKQVALERSTEPTPRHERIWADFLDCPLNKGDWGSLKAWTRSFMKPLREGREKVACGGAFPEDTPTAVILFGPPGTAKTTLASLIAADLRWPLLPVDPSHLIQDGLGDIQGHANTLFAMLAEADQLVVLLDEFDEMVRSRDGTSDILSRFLTTAMLPKLTEIRDRRRIVFLVATNYIDVFDAAIKRLGRFDHLIQVMPPTAEEKKRKWEAKLKPEAWANLMDRKHKKKLSALTYGETKRLLDSVSSKNVLDRLKQAYKGCQLKQVKEPGAEPADARETGEADDSGGPLTWEKAAKRDEQFIR